MVSMMYSCVCRQNAFCRQKLGFLCIYPSRDCHLRAEVASALHRHIATPPQHPLPHLPDYTCTILLSPPLFEVSVRGEHAVLLRFAAKISFAAKKTDLTRRETVTPDLSDPTGNFDTLTLGTPSLNHSHCPGNRHAVFPSSLRNPPSESGESRIRVWLGLRVRLQPSGRRELLRTSCKSTCWVDAEMRVKARENIAKCFDRAN